MTEILGRIISKTSDGSVPVTQTFTYNIRNLLETTTDTVGNAATSVTRLYDSFGNPYSESVSADNVTKTVSRRMTDAKTYQFTYPDGKILRKTATGSALDSIEYNNSEIAIVVQENWTESKCRGIDLYDDQAFSDNYSAVFFCFT